MKRSKKVLAILVALVLIFATAIPSMAAVSPNIGTIAQSLHDMGLYAGTNPNYFVPSLDDPLTREQAFVLFAKAMGKEAKANAVTQQEIKDYILNVFLDAQNFSSWALPFATVLVIDKDVSGRGNMTMGPQDIIAGTEFAILMLKALKMNVDGPTSQYACMALANLGILSQNEAAQLNNKELTRGDAIFLLWKTLENGQIKNGEFIAKDLVNKGVITEAAARAAGLLDAYDEYTAEQDAAAKTAAAEAAVAALVAAPYATAADYEAYKVLLANAEAAVAAAPVSTQAGFNTRINLKKNLVEAAVQAQVDAATLAVNTYCAITDVSTLELSLKAIDQRKLAEDKIAAIIDVERQIDLLATLTAHKNILEGVTVLDLSANGVASTDVSGDGSTQVKLTLALKDATGKEITSSKATKVNVALTNENGVLSESQVVLYNGIGQLLFTPNKITGANKNEIITAVVDATSLNAGISDSVIVVIKGTDKDSNPNAITVKSAITVSADRMILTFDKDINFADYTDANNVYNASKLSITFSQSPTVNVVKLLPVTGNPKQMLVLLDKTTPITKDIENTITVVDKKGASVTSSIKYTFGDVQIPSIESVSVDSKDYKKLNVKFSEPVKDILVAALSGIKLDGTIDPTNSALVATTNDNRDTVVLTFAELISAGSHYLSVGADTYSDFAGNLNKAQVKAFTVTASSTSVSLTVETPSPKMIVVNSTVACSLNTVAATDFMIQKSTDGGKNWGPAQTTDFVKETAAPNAPSASQVVFKASSSIVLVPTDLYRVYAKKGTLIDSTGAKNANDVIIQLDGLTVLDSVAPSIVSVTPDSTTEDKVTIVFSEPVDYASTPPMIVTFYELDANGADKASGAKITYTAITSANFTDKKFQKEMVITPDLEKGTSYRIEITNATDLIGNAAASIGYAKMTTMATATTADKHEVTPATAVMTGSSAAAQITIKFGKDLAVNDNKFINALYAGNYRYGNATTGYSYFPEGTIIMFGANKKTIVILTPMDIDDLDGLNVIVSEFLTSAAGDSFGSNNRVAAIPVIPAP